MPESDNMKRVGLMRYFAPGGSTQLSRARTVATILKYSFSLVLIGMVFLQTGGKRWSCFQLLELLIIVAMSNKLVCANVRLGRIVNAILLLLFNVQAVVLFFGGSYLSLIMLTNIESIQDLIGNFVRYGLAALAVIVISCWPIVELRIPKITHVALVGGLATELAAAMWFGNAYSPLWAYVNLAQDKAAHDAIQAQIENSENVTSAFYWDHIDNYRAKGASLSEQPNVILIFTEGLSQSIVDDERGIMPNVAAYEARSLTFTNYWDHTFATYRGLIGQLYSGYQLNNTDSNTLVSMQDIFAGQGYHTVCINTEPNNLQFTNYLDSMDFQTLISNPGTSYEGPTNTLSDREAYELLLETAKEESAAGTPFFLTMYTFGTHLSLDSSDEVYGDGSNALLNKFYNVDHWFGEFMRALEANGLADNTIVVFTADHATYVDDSYVSLFGMREHPMVDTIPLFIYHAGVEAETIDVGGRNSLDMAPTVFDYLDISVPNYFLGFSLFSPTQNNNSFDTVFFDGAGYTKTGGGRISALSNEEQSFAQQMIGSYLIARAQQPAQ